MICMLEIKDQVLRVLLPDFGDSKNTERFAENKRTAAALQEPGRHGLQARIRREENEALQ